MGNASQGKITETGQIDDTVLFNTPSRLDTNLVSKDVAAGNAGTQLPLFQALSLAKYSTFPSCQQTLQAREAAHHATLCSTQCTPARHYHKVADHPGGAGQGPLALQQECAAFP